METQIPLTYSRSTGHRLTDVARASARLAGATESVSQDARDRCLVAEDEWAQRMREYAARQDEQEVAAIGGRLVLTAENCEGDHDSKARVW